MADIAGISHIDLTVRDVEASARWYADVLGLERVRRAEFPGRTMVVLRHPGTGLIIGLNEHTANPGNRFEDSETGLDHIGFLVSDAAEVQRWQERFVDLGVEHSPVAQTENAAVLVFRDPDNIQLEMYAPRRRG